MFSSIFPLVGFLTELKEVGLCCKVLPKGSESFLFHPCPGLVPVSYEKTMDYSTLVSTGLSPSSLWTIGLKGLFSVTFEVRPLFEVNFVV